MNTANASWMAPFAESYRQLAASAVLGWQKANPDVPVSGLSEIDAFREITGLAREEKPSVLSFVDLHTFLGRLKTKQGEPFPLNHQGPLLETVGQSVFQTLAGQELVYKRSKDEFWQMLEGALALFNAHYPKVKERHEILSFRQEDDNARQVAGDYLQDYPLLPNDKLRGELMQLMNPHPHYDPQTERTTIDGIVGDLTRVLETDFPFVSVRALPGYFKNGAPKVVILWLTEDVSAQDLESFFSSEHARFVEGVELRLPAAEQQNISCLMRFLHLPLVRSLKSLDLSHNQNVIGRVGALAIANSQFLSNLTSLDLKRNKIGHAGSVAIANSKFLSNLTKLNLAMNDIGDVGAEAIANSQFLSKLTSLILLSTGIGVEMSERIKGKWPEAKVNSPDIL